MPADRQHSERPLSLRVEELRTALTPVLGYLEIVAESQGQRPSPEQAHMIDALERQLRRVREVSGELVELCRDWRRDQRIGEAPGRVDRLGGNQDANKMPVGHRDERSMP